MNATQRERLRLEFSQARSGGYEPTLVMRPPPGGWGPDMLALLKKLELQNRAPVSARAKRMVYGLMESWVTAARYEASGGSGLVPASAGGSIDPWRIPNERRKALERYMVDLLELPPLVAHAVVDLLLDFSDPTRQDERIKRILWRIRDAEEKRDASAQHT